jgi:hypothetical protein
MKPFDFAKDSYLITITAWSYEDALKIWKSLVARNYYPTGGKVKQVQFGYEID